MDDRAFRLSSRHVIADLAPAMGLGLAITLVVCGLQLMPAGIGLLLVRVDAADPAAVLRQAAQADARLVSLPASGFAVVQGDAATVRSAFGLAVRWKGTMPCIQKP